MHYPYMDKAKAPLSGTIYAHLGSLIHRNSIVRTESRLVPVILFLCIPADGAGYLEKKVKKKPLSVFKTVSGH